MLGPAAAALTYVVIAGAYIAGSSRVARAVSVDLATLESIETFKGIGFVLVTGLLVFVFSHVAFCRLLRQREQLVSAQQALLHTDSKVTAGLLAATVAHDLNNTLAIIGLGIAELRAASSASDAETLDDMQAAAEEAGGLSKRLSEIARSSATGSACSIDLARTVSEGLELARLHPAVRRCSVTVEMQTGSPIRGHALLIHQMLSNLVINAAEATGPGGRVLVRVQPLEEGGLVEVHDDGPGIPDDQREAIFEAFHTTKATGTGLGLLSVRLCAKLHGGRADVERSPLGGACFRIVLPGSAAPSEVLGVGG